MASYTIQVEDTGAGRGSYPQGAGSGANSSVLGPPTTFNSPATSANWIDWTGNLWQWTLSGQLKVVNTPPSNQLATSLYRPAGENFTDGLVRVYGSTGGTIPYSFPAVNGCVDPVGNNGYCVLYTGGQVTLSRYNSNVQTVLVQSYVVPGLPLAYVLEFKRQTVSSGKALLTVSCYDQGDTGFTAPTWTLSYLDTSALAAGSWGPASSTNAARYSQVDVLVSTGALAGAVATLSANRRAAPQLSVAPPPLGGTQPYTYQWYRSMQTGFTPGAGSLIGGATAVPFSDSGLTAQTQYYYVLRATDSAAAVADSAQLAVKTAQWVIGIIGDSNEVAYGLNENMALAGANLMADRLVAMGYIRPGIVFSTIANYPGTTSGSWVQGSANLNQAITDFNAAGVNLVMVCLGTNDAKDATNTSAATYKANCQSILAGVNAGIPGAPVMFHYSPFLPSIGGFGSGWSEASWGRLLGYQVQLDTLVNGGSVLQGDQQLYNRTKALANLNFNADNAHLNLAGQQTLADCWAEAVVKALPLTVAVSGISRSRVVNG